MSVKIGNKYRENLEMLKGLVKLAVKILYLNILCMFISIMIKGKK